MSVLQAYEEFRARPGNDETTDGQYCAANGVDIAALHAQKLADPQWAWRVLQRRRDSYAEQLLEVDKALLKRALGGDNKAVELMYARFEGWTTRGVDAENRKSGGKKTFAELIAEEE